MFSCHKEKQARDEHDRYERAQLREAITVLSKQIGELNHDIRLLHETLFETHSTYAALLIAMQAKQKNSGPNGPSD